MRMDLDQVRDFLRRYEEAGVFPAGLIDATIASLKGFDDLNMSEKIFGNADSLKNLVNRHLHCG